MEDKDGYIFPAVSHKDFVTQSPFGKELVRRIVYFTNVRKQCAIDKKWYLIPVLTCCEEVSGKEGDNYAHESLQRFLNDVYLCLLYYEINPTFVNHNGCAIVKLDHIQKHERLRVLWWEDHKDGKPVL